jgi:hypothetical protein
VNRQPFIVGEMADKVLAFFAGVIGNVLGLIATIVVMFMWAGSDPTPEVQERRNHANSVSVWSGIGCAIPAVLLLLGILSLLAGATHSTGFQISPTQLVFP